MRVDLTRLVEQSDGTACDDPIIGKDAKGNSIIVGSKPLTIGRWIHGLMSKNAVPGEDITSILNRVALSRDVNRILQSDAEDKSIDLTREDIDLVLTAVQDQGPPLIYGTYAILDPDAIKRKGPKEAPKPDVEIIPPSGKPN